MTINWGSFPDWLSGLGTVTALAFAAVAARAALQTNAQQSAQLAKLEAAEAERLQDRRRRHAEKVAVWIIAPPPGGSPEVWSVNGSGQPLYNVSVACTWGPGRVVYTDYPYLGADTTPYKMRTVTKRFVEEVERVLETSGGRATIHSDETNNTSAIDWEGLHERRQLRVAIMFLDVEGRWWVRDVMGYLVEVPSGSFPKGSLDV